MRKLRWMGICTSRRLGAPGRAGRLEDSLEWNLRTARRTPNGLQLALKRAEHDLVLGHEERAEVADRLALVGERGDGARGALVECAEVAGRDAGPQALDDVF